MPRLESLESYLIDLLQLATDARDRGSLGAILKHIAHEFGANSAMIWSETPFSSLGTNPSKGTLFVLAEWIEPPHKCHLYDLPANSATGRAVISGLPELYVDLEDPIVFKKDGFIRQAGIKTLSIHPFTAYDGKRGSLNLYFKGKHALTSANFRRLELVSRAIPHLTKIIQRNAGHQLTHSVSQILDNSPSLTANTVKIKLKQICQIISGQLHAVEVSLFLRDGTREDSHFRLFATNLPSHIHLKRTSYRANKNDGITGWVLAERKPILLFDVLKFRAQKAAIQEKYPGVEWRGSLAIKKTALRLLIASGEERLPPVSFIAVPVEVENRLLGVLRCSVAKKSPFNFGDIEANLLKMISSQIAQAWSSWLLQRDLYTENLSWQRFVHKIGELNEFVVSNIKSDSPDIKTISERCLLVASEVITKHLVAATHIYDANEGTLKCQSVYGDILSKETIEEGGTKMSKMVNTRPEPPDPIRSRVIQQGKPLIIYNTSREPLPYSLLYQEYKWLVCYPIFAEQELVGLLELRGIANRSFPRHAKPIADLLAKQLGLYSYLTSTISKLRRQPIEFAQSFEDFNHQLRTPILQIHGRARRSFDGLLNHPSIPDETKRELRAIRGLAAKSRTISESLRLFALLAQGKRIPLSLRQFNSNELNRLIVELAVDAQDLSDPTRRLVFRAERPTLSGFVWARLSLDRELLLQALVNLLDNAEKYSFAGTTVTISASLTKSGRFRVGVSNTGIALTDVQNCKRRGWRSSEAEAVTGEGTGIGLWLVDRIMNAHGGELAIQATNPQNLTVFDLLFPLDQSKALGQT